MAHESKNRKQQAGNKAAGKGGGPGSGGRDGNLDEKRAPNAPGGGETPGISGSGPAGRRGGAAPCEAAGIDVYLETRSARKAAEAAGISERRMRKIVEVLRLQEAAAAEKRGRDILAEAAVIEGYLGGLSIVGAAEAAGVPVSTAHRIRTRRRLSEIPPARDSLKVLKGYLGGLSIVGAAEAAGVSRSRASCIISRPPDLKEAREAAARPLKIFTAAAVVKAYRETGDIKAAAEAAGVSPRKGREIVDSLGLPAAREARRAAAVVKAYREAGDIKAAAEAAGEYPGKVREIVKALGLQEKRKAERRAAVVKAYRETGDIKAAAEAGGISEGTARAELYHAGIDARRGKKRE